MLKNLSYCLVLFLAMISLSVNSVNAKDFSVAVVDVDQIANSSSQLTALKKEQQTRAEDIKKFVEKARKDIAATTDVNKKKALEEKYNKELATMQEKNTKDFTTKFKAIDSSISQQIALQAKAKGYDVVFKKGVILYGGNDITADIIKVVK